jgi:hypothetical protein
MDGRQAQADALAAISVETDRLKDWRAAKAGIDRAVLAAAAKAGLAEPVGQGLARDVGMAIGSYIELRAAAAGGPSMRFRQTARKFGSGAIVAVADRPVLGNAPAAGERTRPASDQP